jgi:hypothetical protein
VELAEGEVMGVHSGAIEMKMRWGSVMPRLIKRDRQTTLRVSLGSRELASCTTRSDRLHLDA